MLSFTGFSSSSSFKDAKSKFTQCLRKQDIESRIMEKRMKVIETDKIYREDYTKEDMMRACQDFLICYQETANPKNQNSLRDLLQSLVNIRHITLKTDNDHISVEYFEVILAMDILEKFCDLLSPIHDTESTNQLISEVLWIIINCSTSDYGLNMKRLNSSGIFLAAIGLFENTQSIQFMSDVIWLLSNSICQNVDLRDYLITKDFRPVFFHKMEQIEKISVEDNSTSADVDNFFIKAYQFMESFFKVKPLLQIKIVVLFH